jgi:ABC-type transport system involved in multi-copper enzyme maturation permease subunit
MRITLSVGLVFLIIFIVPFLVYGTLSRVTGLQPPGDDPSAFLAGVAVSKLGTAMAFVGIWMLGRESFGGQWMPYVALWWVMFVFGEVGQAIGPDYRWSEAAAGIVSETIYLPLSGLLVARMLAA